MVFSITKCSQLLVTGYHSVCVCVCVNVCASMCTCILNGGGEKQSAILVPLLLLFCPPPTTLLTFPGPWWYSTPFFFTVFFSRCILEHVEKTKLLSEFMCHKTHALKQSTIQQFIWYILKLVKPSPQFQNIFITL